MMQNKNQNPPLAHELPYWDFVSDPRSHVVLNDGSLAAGLRVSLVDIECLDEREINQFTQGLRAALNSISEGTTIQFLLSVRSDYSEMIESHRASRSPSTHSLVQTIADHRDQALRLALASGELYRPELFVFIRTPMLGQKKAGRFAKREAFSDQAALSYQETLEVLSQNIDTLISSFQRVGLECRELTRSETLAKVYQFLNPIGSSRLRVGSGASGSSQR